MRGPAVLALLLLGGCEQGDEYLALPELEATDRSVIVLSSDGDGLRAEAFAAGPVRLRLGRDASLTILLYGEALEDLGLTVGEVPLDLRCVPCARAEPRRAYRARDASGPLEVISLEPALKARLVADLERCDPCALPAAERLPLDVEQQVFFATTLDPGRVILGSRDGELRVVSEDGGVVPLCRTSTTLLYGGLVQDHELFLTTPTALLSLDLRAVRSVEPCPFVRLTSVTHRGAYIWVVGGRARGVTQLFLAAVDGAFARYDDRGWVQLGGPMLPIDMGTDQGGLVWRGPDRAFAAFGEDVYFEIDGDQVHSSKFQPINGSANVEFNINSMLDTDRFGLVIGTHTYGIAIETASGWALVSFAENSLATVRAIASHQDALFLLLRGGEIGAYVPGRLCPRASSPTLANHLNPRLLIPLGDHSAVIGDAFKAEGEPNAAVVLRWPAYACP